MGNKNQVTLTLAGDTAQLEKAFDRVGAAGKKMGEEVGASGSGFDKAAASSDALDTKAMGFRDTVTGVEDSVKGFGALLKGDFSAGALVTAGMGVGDLASGFTNFLIPMGKSIVQLGAHKVALAGHAIASGVAKAATLTWTGIQWLLNAALTANPIGLIVVGIVLLIGVIVLIATKTTWFQDIWKVAWKWIKDTAGDVWEWLKTLPDKIGGAFKKIADHISLPFKIAFNLVSDAWNNTIGKLSWTVPGWIPGIGGNTISAPKLPKFHSGGTVPGAPGTEMMAILQAGERVSPVGSGANTVLELRSSGSRVDDLLVEILRSAVRARGGNVQLVVGANRG